MKKVALLLVLLVAGFASAQICEGKSNDGKKHSILLPFGPNYSGLQLEKLGRGLVAVHQNNGITVSWRILMDDRPNIEFDLYRKTYIPGVYNNKEVKLNKKTLKESSFFIDKEADTTLIQEYRLVDRKAKKRSASFLLTPEKAAKPYFSIPLPRIGSDSLDAYRPASASVGDLDGDGEYEIILLRRLASFTTSQRGISGGSNHLEAYRMDGRRLWQMDLGPNIREGSAYFPFMVYDFDGDGRAEIICKTAEGTVFGDGKITGDENQDGITDYIIRDTSSVCFGKILTGPEFLSVIEGATGRELDRVAYIDRGDMLDWGDNEGINVDKNGAAVAYLDGMHPSCLVSRGSKGKNVVEAWNFRNGKLTRLWTFNTQADNQKYIAWTNQQDLAIRVGDVDFDGKDELIFGACCIDHNGGGLYTTGWGRGESLQLADIDPDRPGLEVWQGHEYAPNPSGASLRNGANSKLLWGIPSKTTVNRVMCAELDPDSKGMEVWSSNSVGVFSCKGKRLSGVTPLLNTAVWWDGDLCRELCDKFYIEKWTNRGSVRLFDGKGKGLTWCNGSRNSPCLTADILGDWREEVIWPSLDGREIRIYTTSVPTEYRFTTFMQDPMYRTGVAGENAGYGQTPQCSFFPGYDKKTLQRVRH